MLLGVEWGIDQQAAHPDDGVERRSDLVAHGRQERALCLVCLFRRVLGLSCLGIQAGVLDRRPDIGRQRGEQAGIRVAEAALLLRALYADDADGRVTDEDRYAEIRAGRRSDDGRTAIPEMLLAIEQERLPRLHDPRGQPFAILHRALRLVAPVLNVVREFDMPGVLVEERQVHDVGLERLAHLLADKVD